MGSSGHLQGEAWGAYLVCVRAPAQVLGVIYLYYLKCF